MLPTVRAAAIRTFILAAADLAVAPEDIRPGCIVASLSGQRYFRVVRRDILVTAGQPAAKRRIRLLCDPVKRADLPSEADIAPWPAKPKAADRPKVSELVHAADSRPQPLATHHVTERPKRDEPRQRRQDHRDVLVDPIRVRPIIGPDGEEIRGPTAMRGEWRDPEDTDAKRRTARVIAGWKKADPLVRLGRDKGALIKKEHVLAADQYRLTWERGYGGARPGYERPEVQNSYYGPVSGPVGDHAPHMRRFDSARKFAGIGRPELLDAVVIDCQDVSTWARNHGVNRQVATGILISQLTLLAEFYETEIRMAQRTGQILEEEGARA